VVAAQTAIVSPTNFGGYDEWLIVHLTATGRYSIPYASRPFELFWDMPAPLLFPHRIAAYLWLHAAYLWLAGVLVWAAVRRLAPAGPLVPFVAGVLAATWAPGDSLRLNAVETVAYSGVLAVTMIAAALAWTAWTRRSWPVFGAAALLAVLAARTYESVVPLLAAAPALFWADAAPGRERTRWAWAAAWVAIVAAAGAAAVFGVTAPSTGSYQMSALRLDLSPLGLVRRIGAHAAFHIGPAFSLDAAHVWPAALLPLAAYAAGALPLALRPQPGGARWEPRAALAGAALAALGWSVFALSPAIRTAERTQFLSAPGVAVLLAALVSLVTRPLPPRARPAAILVLGGWLVAAGAARTSAMQAEWDRTGYWSAQRDSLREIARAVPDVVPGTLVVLLDERGAWPASFTFRHAMLYLYDGRAAGHVVGAHQFLYPTRFVAGGALTEPLPDVRGPWSAPVTLHGAAQIVVVTLGANGGARIEETWPAVLPAESGAGYAPRARIVATGVPPAARAALDSGP
jgi:hypothetical protein